MSQLPSQPRDVSAGPLRIDPARDGEERTVVGLGTVRRTGPDRYEIHTDDGRLIAVDGGAISPASSQLPAARRREDLEDARPDERPAGAEHPLREMGPESRQVPRFVCSSVLHNVIRGIGADSSIVDDAPGVVPPIPERVRHGWYHSAPVENFSSAPTPAMLQRFLDEVGQVMVAPADVRHAAVAGPQLDGRADPSEIDPGVPTRIRTTALRLRGLLASHNSHVRDSALAELRQYRRVDADLLRDLLDAAPDLREALFADDARTSSRMIDADAVVVSLDLADELDLDDQAMVLRLVREGARASLLHLAVSQQALALCHRGRPLRELDPGMKLDSRLSPGIHAVATATIIVTLTRPWGEVRRAGVAPETRPRKRACRALSL